MKQIKRFTKRAFSLVEMMIVLTVVGILLAFAAPDLFSLIQSNSLSAEGQNLRNQLTQAQQLALANNSDVEVRFYKLADEAAAETKEGYRAYQFFQFNKRGEMVEVTKFFRINAPVILSERMSTILEEYSGTTSEVKYGMISPREGEHEIPLDGKMVSTEYMAFRFLADGSTDLPNRSGSDTWYVTLVQGIGAAESEDVDNYYCLQVNPYNGQVTEFRP